MKTPHGLIDQSELGRKNDYLYRISLKALVVNEKNEVLVVKEAGRTWWDLPGGGMDHDESIKDALARELHEEVSFVGDFEYRVIDVDEPMLLVNANVWQVRLIFKVVPKTLEFTPGVDGDEARFMDAMEFEDSDNEAERRVYRYFEALENTHLY
jgi:8-oxo-dGTP pyrophosphatase MutT (NUDIX family)